MDTRAEGLHAAYQTACQIAERDRAAGIDPGETLNNILGQLAILAGGPLTRTTAAWWVRRILFVFLGVCLVFWALIGMTAYLVCS